MKAYSIFLEERDEIIQNTELVISRLTDCTEQEAQKKELEQEIAILVDMVQNCVAENARIAIDQDKYQEHYNGLVERYEAEKVKHESVCGEIGSRSAKVQTLGQFLKWMKEDGVVTEFDSILWSDMVDFVTVDSKKQMIFTFKNGAEITV